MRWQHLDKAVTNGAEGGNWLEKLRMQAAITNSLRSGGRVCVCWVVKCIKTKDHSEISLKPTKTTPENMCYTHIKQRGSPSPSSDSTPPPRHMPPPYPTHVQP